MRVQGSSIAGERPFLTAEWRDLIMVTWTVDAGSLRPHLADGTELDLWRGQAVASLVAFDFRDTRVLGVAIPFHRRFPEINLRFYVRHRTAQGEWRHGVTFVQEMVPKAAITLVARNVYGEPYVTRPMRRVAVPDHPLDGRTPGTTRSIVHEWRRDGEWERLVALATAAPTPLPPDSVDEFVAVRHWGYTRRPGRGTVAYHVAHPRWRATPLADCLIEADLRTLYGPRFADAFDAAPVSRILADGSAVSVYRGRPIDAHA